MEDDHLQGADTTDFQDNSGDTLGFDTIFKRVYKPLCFFAFKLIADHDKAEDIVQDCLLRFWQRRKHEETFIKIQSFLYVSVRNACLDELEHQKVKSKHQDYVRVTELNTEPPVLDAIMQAEVLHHVFEEVENLPEKCREIIKLTFMEGYSPNEISDRLGVTVSTVTNQKLRGLAILRKRLSNEIILLLSAVFLDFF